MLDGLETVFLNFGLAGATILMFYSLIKKEIADLKKSIDGLSDKILLLVRPIG